jgi:hypothetical protein
MGSMVAGLMVYGTDIFNPSGMPFVYYLAYGFSSACIFAFYHMRGLSNTVSAAMVFGAALFIGIAFILPVLIAAIYSFGVTVSVILLAFLFERKLATFKQWKFTVVGIVFGELFVLLNLVSMVVSHASGMSAVVFQRNFLDGLCMGIGLGIGIEIAESITNSVDQHRDAKKTAQEKISAA